MQKKSNPSEEDATPSFDDLLTTKQAAALIGVSHKGLENRRSGYGPPGPPFLKIGPAVMYRRADLLKWAAIREGRRHAPVD